VAHTINDALDVIDCANDCYHHSILNLIGVAGALVSDERNLVFTSNRGENTVGIFSPDDEASLVKVSVGVRPNGLSYDPIRIFCLRPTSAIRRCQDRSPFRWWTLSDVR